SLILLPADVGAVAWERYFEQLVLQNRAVTARVGDQRFWVLVEKRPTFTAIFPGAIFDPEPGAFAGESPSRAEAIFQTVQGWMMHSGPLTAVELAMRLQIPANEIE